MIQSPTSYALRSSGFGLPRELGDWDWGLRAAGMAIVTMQALDLVAFQPLAATTALDLSAAGQRNRGLPHQQHMSRIDLVHFDHDPTNRTNKIWIGCLIIMPRQFQQDGKSFATSAIDRKRSALASAVADQLE